MQMGKCEHYRLKEDAEWNEFEDEHVHYDKTLLSDGQIFLKDPARLFGSVCGAFLYISGDQMSPKG